MGAPDRGLPGGAARAGYTTMLQGLPPQAPHEPAVLRALAATMKELSEPETPAAELARFRHSHLFAGLTYLAQFVDHDLTLDRARFGWPSDAAPLNHRTPRFDLESVFGGGPKVSPVLYRDDGLRLRLSADGMDLMRHPDGHACIGDSRNDSNAIILQLHVAFIRFYHRVVDGLLDDGVRPDQCFEQARRIVQWHYQWIVFHELLGALMPQGLFDAFFPADFWRREAAERVDLLRRRLRLFSPDPGQPVSIPKEFVGAAYRFGHSMVRATYVLRVRNSAQTLVFDRGSPDDLDADDLRGGRPLSAHRRLDWERFFPWPGEAARGAPRAQLARPIDALIAPPLYGLPFLISEDSSEESRSLPYRNLYRGERQLGLPSGQDVAKRLLDEGLLDARDVLGIDDLVRIDGFQGNRHDVANTGLSLAALQQHVGARAPLWYYLLKEAQHLGQGEHLGPAAGRIVLEVFVGLLLHDRTSIVHQTGWQPERGACGCRSSGEYTMADLLAYAQAPG